MQVNYLVEIKDINQSFLDVRLTAEKSKTDDTLVFFLPSWSPGSYLLREYSRHIHWLKVETGTGEALFFEQNTKNSWKIDWSKSDLNNTDTQSFSIQARFYCHDLTVRTSYIDNHMAFLHGPTFLFGFENQPMNDPIVEIRFPNDWSKVSTGLKEYGEQDNRNRAEFKYTAENYDVLLDSPILIGCHETDGFMYNGKPHELAFTGKILAHGQDLKKDIITIVETVSGIFKDKDLPYEKYSFLSILKPGLYGGLEHLNSTALVFDARKLQDRKSYLKWVELVAHEYFHTWNIKRIRPRELGPFDYLNENYTSMLWLAEGLTSFMDQYFVYRSGLCTFEEYLEAQKENLNAYLKIPGRHFHSLEQSSFNAWTKLYRPDEFSTNSTVSYYLKGGIAFFLLHVLLVESGKNTDELVNLLWEGHKRRPDEGFTSEEVFELIEGLGGSSVRNSFESWVKTTVDFPLEDLLTKAGLEIEWEYPESAYSGIVLRTTAESIFVDTVIVDSPAYKSGIFPGDEIIAIDSIRIDANSHVSFLQQLIPEHEYEILIARKNVVESINLRFGKTPRSIKQIKVVDAEVAKKVF